MGASRELSNILSESHITLTHILLVKASQMARPEVR